MNSSDLIMAGSYNYGLVALSIAIAMLGSYATIDLAGRVRATHGGARLSWRIGGAIAMAIGTWAMHYTGMLAFRLPIPISYDWPISAVSFVPSLLASAVALVVVIRPRMESRRAFVASIFIGGGVAGLHYTAMASMRMQGMHHYSPALVTVSVLLAMVFSLLSLWLTFLFRDEPHGWKLRKVASVALMGTAIWLMHYTGMASVTFTASATVPDLSQAMRISSLSAAGIGAVALMVLIVALLTATWDRLQEDKALLDELFEQGPEAIVLLNVDQSIVRLNREFTRIFGYSQQDAIGRRLSELIVPYEFQNEYRAYTDMVRHGQRVDAEGVRQRKDSSRLNVSIIQVPVSLPDGQIATYAIFRDITGRKQAEALLHAKEQEFRAIVENAPDQIIRYDREFRRTYVNPAVLKAYGLPAEALTGKLIGSVIRDAGLDVNEGEQAQLRQVIEAVFDTGEVQEYEMTWPTPVGRRSYSVRFFPELDLGGSVINVLGISRDITERRSAEEELKKEKEILEKVFDNIPVMIGFVGDDGTVKLVNPEWERTIGWTVKELQEQNVDIFAEAYPDLSYRQQVLDFMAASTGEWVDLKIKVRDGRVIDAACAVVLLSDGTKIAIAQDITERKRAEERIRATSEQLRALSASVQSAKEEEGTRIAREIHDELGGALTSLKWDLESLHKVTSESTDQSLVQALDGKVEAMLRLSETTISAVRRISSELRPSVLDDLGLVAAIEWQARQFQTRTGIICHYECAVEKVDLDREQSTAMFRILQEALTNILRHAQATRVDIAIKEEAGEIVMTVSDNGRGITEDEKSRLQSLGLLGMRERAHLIGAEIDIIGVDAQGTVVTVRVPNAK